MRLALGGVVLSVASVLVACGGGSDSKTTTPTAPAGTSTPATTATRPAATSTAAPAPTATSAPSTAVAAPSPTQPADPAPTSTEAAPPPPPPPPPPTEAPSSSGATLSIGAVDVAFDKSALSAPPGPITIVFTHNDPSVAHNIHVFSKSGSIGMTEITTGPVTDTLSLGTLTPGSYSYKCDVHPQTMTGVLTVSDPRGSVP